MNGGGRTAGFSFSDQELPVRLGRYYLLRRLSADPIGEEFLAAWGVEEGLDQLRLLRCVYPAVAAEQQFVGIFSEEARSLSRLSSANAVRVMEVGQEGGIPFVASEHVEGVTLARLIDLAEARRSLWPWELAAHVAAELLRGLDYVHRREDIHGRPMGMRHGDVRPDNVLISFGGEVKLSNFGTSLRFIVDEKTNARLREIRRRYVPPEGADQLEPEVGADLWSVGMILLHLLAGGIPFAGPDEVAEGWVPPAMSSRVEAMPMVLDTFLARALNPDPAYRFSDAAEMRTALVEIVAQHVSGHPPDDLAAWARDLGDEDRIAEVELVRRMLGREAQIRLGDTIEQGSLASGAVLDGRYHLLRVLGEGGMGIVFEAEHLGLGRKVAIKVLHDRVLDDANSVERFRREARIIGGLGHANIVGASDFGVTPEGHHYLAMDLLDGVSLSSRIAERDLSPSKIAQITAEVCDGLEAAHTAGVIHRDLKPDNIYLTTNGVRILDFGIAKRTGLEDEDQALTRTGHICGTVEYIAPEQIRGLSHDPRSDLYAVGVIIYEALTGQTPFHGRTVGETLHRALNDKLVPPRKRTGDKTIPVEMEAVCIKALSRRAENRFQTASEMAEALRELLPSEAQTVEIRRPRVGSLPWLAALGAAAVVFIASGAWWIASHWSAEEGGGVAAGIDDTDAAERDTALIADDTDAGEERATGSVPICADAGIAATDGGTGIVRPDDTSAPDSDPVEDKVNAEEHAKELVEQGQRELARMRLDRAGSLFREALKQNSRASAAWYGLGRVAFEQSRYGEAESKVRRALRYAPGRVAYRNFLGQILLTQGRKDEAVSEWQRVLLTRPGNAEAKRLLRAAGVDVE